MSGENSHFLSTIPTGLFESVVVIQNVFCLEIHQNNIFFIFKKLFLRLAYQNNKKNIKQINKKNFFFLKKS